MGWGGCIPAKGRLISGDSELLLGMEVVWELRLTVDFDERFPQVGQGEWHVMVRNRKARGVFPLSPTARECEKLELSLANMGNCEIDVSTIRADIGSGFDARGDSESKQDRRRKLATWEPRW